MKTQRLRPRVPKIPAPPRGAEIETLRSWEHKHRGRLINLANQSSVDPARGHDPEFLDALRNYRLAVRRVQRTELKR